MIHQWNISRGRVSKGCSIEVYRAGCTIKIISSYTQPRVESTRQKRNSSRWYITHHYIELIISYRLPYIVSVSKFRYGYGYYKKTSLIRNTLSKPVVGSITKLPVLEGLFSGFVALYGAK